MTMLAFQPEQLRHLLLASMQRGLDEIERSSETAFLFARNPAALPKSTLIRHEIEHVFRIRMFREADAKAGEWLRVHVPETHEKWSEYARSEAVHDRYFLHDLASLGYDRSRVEQFSPFASTKALAAYVDGASEKFGALPVVLYSFWTEHNSDVGTTPVIESVAATFGSGVPSGSRAHRALDEHEDHASVVNNVLGHLIESQRTLALAMALLDGISLWIGAYFAELETSRYGANCSVEPMDLAQSWSK